MQNKLKTVVISIIGLIILSATNTYATGYCGTNIVQRAISPHSIGKQNISKLCDTYDNCNAKNGNNKSNCDKQFSSQMASKCLSLYGKKILDEASAYFQQKLAVIY